MFTNYKFKIISLGCKVNYYEKEAMTKILEELGMILVTGTEVADIYVINTCSVTNESDKKSRKLIRACHNENEEAIIIVTGCYAQIKPEDVAKLPGVKIVLGNNKKDKVKDYLLDYLKEKTQIMQQESLLKKTNYDSLLVDKFYEHTRAYLKIQDGCTNFCSYCIIPYARGTLRSKPLDECILEAKHLVKNGHKEIILSGIHTGAYGVDLGITLFDLLKELIQIDGLLRLRISSIEINELTDQVLALIKTSNVIVNHLHVPIQSGSNGVLHRMNRKYTVDEFKKRISYIRQMVPKIAITTDCIVGFPGETEEEFAETLSNLKEINFQQIHVFPFSKREGTKAATMPNQIDGLIKKARVNELLAMSDVGHTEYAKSLIGVPQHVIFEEIVDGYLTGHTDTFLLVHAKGNEENLNKLVTVRITEVSDKIYSEIEQ